MMAARGVRVLYEEQDFPIFQNRMYPTFESARDCPKGDIQLVEDLATGLIYNAAFRPQLMQYDAHYQNEQALSPLFRDHLNNVAEIVEAGMGRVGIVEIGCGKAFFLEMLLAKGFDITGYDPTYEGGNPRVIRKYFQRGEGLVAKGMILRHVLEHIQDPLAFLMALKDANGGGGKIYIEVPSMEWICARRAWFDIFYEHVNYFRLIDLFRLFEGIDASGYLFGGQYLYVIADLSRLRRPIYDEQNAIDFPRDFRRTLIAQSPEPRAQSPEPRAQSPEPRAQSPEPRAQSPQVAIWGGASKGVIFALLRERIGAPIFTVIDVNPAKQGKYLPATGLRVQSPEEALQFLPRGATIYVMNSNYLPEIIEMSNHAYHYIGIDNV